MLPLQRIFMHNKKYIIVHLRDSDPTSRFDKNVLRIYTKQFRACLPITPSVDNGIMRYHEFKSHAHRFSYQS